MDDIVIRFEPQLTYATTIPNKPIPARSNKVWGVAERGLSVCRTPCLVIKVVLFVVEQKEKEKQGLQALSLVKRRPRKGLTCGK